jgi:UDP-N-acetylglucosamine 4,6-dehydratase
MFKDKVLMITGGTGSFGNSVLKGLIDSGLKKIVIFSRDEKKQEEMRLALNNPKVRFVIGDVRDFNSIYSHLSEVDYLFHAAALKHVPPCEFYPMQATLTNIIGTDNVIRAALEKKVKRVVLLSTDKAVYPINAMGISKAMAERILIAQARLLDKKASTILCATRYGNVIASRGSVIPVFINSIKSGKTLSITDPTMTRFLMSLEQSVDLVLHAFKNGEQGDIFVQKSPACRIGDLAEVLCEIFNVNVRIKTIGTRHGEKHYESLISREEMTRATDLGKYWRIRADNRDLNYELFITKGSPDLNKLDDYASNKTEILSKKALKDLLLTIPFVKQELAGWRSPNRNKMPTNLIAN